MAGELLVSEIKNEARDIITSGKISSAVWYVAWPTVINTLVMTAYMLINRVFLGHLKHGAADALAASGIGGAVLNIQFSLMLGLSIGAAALVSRFIGARQDDEALDATRQSLIISAIVGLLSGLPLVMFASPIVTLVGAKSGVVPLASSYMAIIAYSSIVAFLYMIITTVLRSTGDVRSPLYAGVIIIALNVLFDWLLIFGIGPFPAMGVVGAAVATVIARLAGMLLILWFFNRSMLAGSLRHLHVNFSWFSRIMNIGWPVMLQSLIWSVSGATIVGILGGLKNATDAQAALTLGLAIESVAFMPGVAYATAVTPLVGQNLGAGCPKRAEHCAWVATAHAVCIMTVVAIVFFIIPKQLALLFTSDKNVIPLVISYLRIVAISEPFLALGMVLKGALQGAGDVIFTLFVTVFTFFIVRLPFAALLINGFGFDANGAWIAMTTSTIFHGLLIVWWFMRGNWKAVEV